MKRFVKIYAAVITAALLLIMSGCSARTPLSADDFKKQAENQKFTVTAETSSDSSIDKYMIADKSGTDTKIVYLSFSDNSSARDQYASLKEDAAPSGGGDAVDSDSYNKYTVTNGELYYTIARIDNTVIYCKTTTTHKDEADNFMKAVKY